MYQDELCIAVVNFHARWGDKPANIEKMKDYVQKAAQQKVQLLVFPELALTGYDNIPQTPYEEKMQVQNAEPIPGPTSSLFGDLAKKHNMYIIWGMPEQTGQNVRNSAAICCPDGRILSYQKMHLPVDEGQWAKRGSQPMTFDTEFGPIGLSICYDSICYPELIRLAKAQGARLYVSPVACGDGIFANVPLRQAVECHSLLNYIYTATANLCGDGPLFHMIGASSVIGLADDNLVTAKYEAGLPFGADNADQEGMFVAHLDLSQVEKRAFVDMYRRNPHTGQPDLRPEVYAKAYQAVADSEAWQDKGNQ